MWRLWNMGIGRGKLINEETQQVNWSVNWGAFRAARSCQHPLTRADPSWELYEAMVVIQHELQRPTAELIQEQAEGDG